MSDLNEAQAIAVVSTFPDPTKAAEIANILVVERLAACVNIIPQVRSIYRWEGAVHDDGEALAIIKTTQDRFEALSARVLSLHPYQVPELVTLPITAGHAPYLAWLRGSISDT